MCDSVSTRSRSQSRISGFCGGHNIGKTFVHPLKCRSPGGGLNLRGKQEELPDVLKLHPEQASRLLKAYQGLRKKASTLV